MTGVRAITQINFINHWAKPRFTFVEMNWPRGQNKMLSYNDRVQIVKPPKVAEDEATRASTASAFAH
jgi:hypothetical protein